MSNDKKQQTRSLTIKIKGNYEKGKSVIRPNEAHEGRGRETLQGLLKAHAEKGKESPLGFLW
jgi:hypothetical protein